MMNFRFLLLIPFFTWSTFTAAQSIQPSEPMEALEPMDLFEIENISDPQISPDGKHVIYVRNARSVMKDQTTSNLWMIDYNGDNHIPLTVGSDRNYAPRWSPDSKQLIYLSNREGTTQLYRRWMDSGHEAIVADLPRTPSNLSWSPNGQWIAFSMFVPEMGENLVKLPRKPVGAKWADQPLFIDELRYRSDGQGYLKEGHTQLFILSIDGGYPRQLTNEPYNHGGNLEWALDGNSILFSANRHEDGEYYPANSEIYEIELVSGKIKALTNRKGL